MSERTSERIDKLFLELSQLTTAKTERELRLERALKFFASVIKSGEGWSESCERTYRTALSAALASGEPARTVPHRATIHDGKGDVWESKDFPTEAEAVRYAQGYGAPGSYCWNVDPVPELARAVPACPCELDEQCDRRPGCQLLARFPEPARAVPEEEPPCYVCGNEERDHREILTCRCPASLTAAEVAYRQTWADYRKALQERNEALARAVPEEVEAFTNRIEGGTSYITAQERQEIASFLRRLVSERDEAREQLRTVLHRESAAVYRHDARMEAAEARVEELTKALTMLKDPWHWPVSLGTDGAVSVIKWVANYAARALSPPVAGEDKENPA